MVIYDNEFETKENKLKPMIKLNHNITTDFRAILFRPHLVVGLG